MDDKYRRYLFFVILGIAIGYIANLWWQKRQEAYNQINITIVNEELLKLTIHYDSLDNERKVLIQKIYLLQSIENDAKCQLDTMKPETKLTLINNELLDLRNYIDALQKDKTITIYTAQSMLAKIDRCNRIQDGMILSKNR